MSQYPDPIYIKADMAELKTVGEYGRVRIDATGTDSYTGPFYAIKAITDNFTYGSNCTARTGDTPQLGDAVLQGDVDI